MSLVDYSHVDILVQICYKHTFCNGAVNLDPGGFFPRLNWYSDSAQVKPTCPKPKVVGRQLAISACTEGKKLQ